LEQDIEKENLALQAVDEAIKKEQSLGIVKQEYVSKLAHSKSECQKINSKVNTMRSENLVKRKNLGEQQKKMEELSQKLSEEFQKIKNQCEIEYEQAKARKESYLLGLERELECQNEQYASLIQEQASLKEKMSLISSKSKERNDPSPTQQKQRISPKKARDLPSTGSYGGDSQEITSGDESRVSRSALGKISRAKSSEILQKRKKMDSLAEPEPVSKPAKRLRTNLEDESQSQSQRETKGTRKLGQKEKEQKEKEIELEKEKERQRQKEIELEKEKERQRKKEKELERERERQQEKEKERKREMERDKHQKEKKDRERQKEKEKEKERDAEAQKERENDIKIKGKFHTGREEINSSYGDLAVFEFEVEQSNGTKKSPTRFKKWKTTIHKRIMDSKTKPLWISASGSPEDGLDDMFSYQHN